MSKSYAAQLSEVLTPAERRILRKLSTPQKIQNYLDRLPINFELRGETYMSPRRTLVAKTAHCFEGALLAAAAFALHGQKPLLMDFRTAPDDEDHVIALYRQSGLWGAISKTNHAILRYRDPVYRSYRELAMSYFHEYLQWDGRKTLREFSAPFDLSRYAPKKWVIAPEEMQWLVDDLDSSRHFPVAPQENVKLLRKALPVELRAMKVIEWNKRGKKLR